MRGSSCEQRAVDFYRNRFRDRLRNYSLLVVARMRRGGKVCSSEPTCVAITFYQDYGMHCYLFEDCATAVFSEAGGVTLRKITNFHDEL